MIKQEFLVSHQLSLLPPSKRNMQLEIELNNLKVENARVRDEFDEAQSRIKFLETEVERLSIKIENEDDNIANIENLQVEIKRLSTENIRYSELVKEQTEEIHDLKNSVKMKTHISNQINKNFSKFRTKSEKESAVEKKSDQAEIKYWKKELGSERKQKIKLENKLR